MAERALPLTARRLNRATLGRQLLLERAPVTAVEAVRRVVALQAQEPASPYLALWNRVVDLDPRHVDSAFAHGALLKATLVRITLHVVASDDHPLFQRAMATALRASRLNDRRFTDTGLTTDDVDALVPDLLEFTSVPRTTKELEGWVEERLGPASARAWWALRTFAPVVHAPTGLPWSFGSRAAYRAAPVLPATAESSRAVQHLVRRYLEGFGPASAHDVAQWTILRMPVVRAALDALADSLVILHGPDGTVLHDVRGGALPAEDTPAPPRLMAMWDSVLLAHADRSRIIPPEHRAHVIRRNGDVLPTLLVDGCVAGVWRPVDGGIEATALSRLGDDAWEALAVEASALVPFLAERDPRVYRRYARWWDALPKGEVRVLTGSG